MELIKQRRLESGLVSERFPEVSGMVIQMTYYQERGVNPVLMERVVNVFPTGYAYFHMECMIKGCVHGGFDLTSAIRNMVKAHKRLTKGKIVCEGKIDTIDCEHASITYEIRVQYKKPS